MKILDNLIVIILTFFLASWRSTISSHRLFSFSFAIVFSEENHFLIRSSRNFLISIFLFVAFWYTIYAFTMVVPKRKYNANLRYHLMIFRMLLQLSGRFYRCRFFHYYMQLPLMISFFEDDRDEWNPSLDGCFVDDDFQHLSTSQYTLRSSRAIISSLFSE